MTDFKVQLNESEEQLNAYLELLEELAEQLGEIKVQIEEYVEQPDDFKGQPKDVITHLQELKDKQDAIGAQYEDLALLFPQLILNNGTIASFQ